MHSRKSSKGIRDLSEDKFLQTEEQYDEVENKSLKKKRRCCSCCKRFFAVKDLRLAMLDFGQQSAIDKNLAKLLESGKSLVDKHVERGSLKDLKEYHERLDFSKRITMQEHRKKAKIKVLPPDLKKIAVKTYATAPSVKKFGLANVTSKTFNKLRVEKASSMEEVFSDVSIANRVLNTIVGTRGNSAYTSVSNFRSDSPKQSVKTKLISLFKRVDVGRPSVLSELSKSASNIGSLTESHSSLPIGIPSSRDSIFSQKSMNDGRSISGPPGRKSFSPLHASGRPSINPSPSPNNKMSRMTRLQEDVKQQITKKFEINWGSTSRHCTTWLNNYTRHKFSATDRKTIDRWYVILYSDSGEKDEWLRFCNVFIKQIFALNQVPFQERDLDVKRDEYEPDLKKKLGRHSKVDTPLVFISGLRLGGGEVVYNLHKTRRAKEAFRKYIVRSRKMYDDWLYLDSHEHQVEELHVKANIDQYPSLEAVSQGMKAGKLSNQLKIEINEGKEYVKLLKLKWIHDTGRQYTDVNWAKFAMLQAQIRGLFKMMDRIFWGSLFPDRTHVYFSMPWQRMAGEIRKRAPPKSNIIAKLKNKTN